MRPSSARALATGRHGGSSSRTSSTVIITAASRPRLMRMQQQQQRQHSRAAAAAADAAAAAAADAPPRLETSPLVKVCGVTNPSDARAAAAAGADLVGMIMWPRAKRSVSDATAREIAGAARAGGALPVGVFVDEGAAEIVARCRASGLRAAQLHGDGARAALAELDPGAVPVVVYVLHASEAGEVATALPPTAAGVAAAVAAATAATTAEAAAGGRLVPLDLENVPRRKRGAPTFLLYDGLQGGGGRTFDWAALLAGARPADAVRACGALGGWALAGGLGPANVSQAVMAARPDLVDVSSGVCGPDGLLKDGDKVVAFVRGAKEAPAANGGA